VRKRRLEGGAKLGVCKRMKSILAIGEGTGNFGNRRGKSKNIGREGGRTGRFKDENTDENEGGRA
jgi:hypothetical protein